MTKARALAPRVSDDSFNATLVEVVLDQVVADFRRTLGRTDGVRSAQVAYWAGEIQGAVEGS